jgi:hypothetical protein
MLKSPAACCSSVTVTIVASQSKAKIIAGPIIINKGKNVFYVIDNMLIPPKEILAQGQAASNSTRASPAPQAANSTTNTSAPAPRSSAASATFSLAAVAGLVLIALL